MKARLTADLPSGDEWMFEVKLDGVRALGIRNGSEVRLWSRRPRDLSADYPEIVEALQRLPENAFVVDGEIVWLDEQGRSSFQLLQNRKRQATGRRPVFFYLFDVLHLGGRNLQSLPLEERKTVLGTLLHGADDPLRFCASFAAAPAKIWGQIQKLGLEGVIAKQRHSRYEAGRRSGAWLKIKAQNQQEFVIGGYTAPQGSRRYFGAVLVGYYEGRKLIFASKVGTGYDDKLLGTLFQLFQKHRTEQCPFNNLPTRRQGRYGQGITTAEMARCAWLEPRLVCQVRFQEWTQDGNLRQPVFLGLREDTPPKRVRREQAGGAST